MKSIEERHGYYQEYIRRLGDMPLDRQPNASELEVPSRVQQTAYREMRELGFKGGLIDYLAWTFGMFILSTWNRWLNNQPDHPPAANTADEGINQLFGLFGYSIFPFIRALDVIRVIDLNEFVSRTTGQDNRMLMLEKIRLLSVYREIEREDGDNKDNRERFLKTGATTSSLDNQKVTPGLTASNTTTQPQSTNQPNKRKKATLPAREK